MRTGALLFLAVLLILPGLAFHRLFTVSENVWIVAAYVASSGVAYTLYAVDKRRARSSGWRIPEVNLHLLELLGGWPGAFLAQQRLRHKNAKVRFQFVFWLIVASHQYLALDYLRGWNIAQMFAR